jgi:hypothetical protein
VLGRGVRSPAHLTSVLLVAEHCSHLGGRWRASHHSENMRIISLTRVGGAQGARKARMQRALGAAALEVKPLSASADFHDELTSVRAAAGKLLDSEEGQATSTAVQMNQVSVLCDTVYAPVCIHMQQHFSTAPHTHGGLRDVWVRCGLRLAMLGRRCSRSRPRLVPRHRLVAFPAPNLRHRAPRHWRRHLAWPRRKRACGW